MKRNSLRTQKLNVLLLKDSIKSFRDALSKPNSLINIPLREDIGFEGEFWYLEQQSRGPSWQSFVNPILTSSLPEFMMSSVSAVLFVKESNRIFAFTFGYGRNLLKPDCYELGFGLKVALNRIHHERIRSLDIRTYEDVMVSTRKQTSRSAELWTFGLDVTRDLLRVVTGEPDDKTFAKRITGADALTLNVSIKVNQLGDKCRQLLDAFYDSRYKEHFDWVDQIKEVRDKKIIDSLNQKLINSIKTRDTENIYLAPPEVLDWQSVEKFCIEGTRQEEYDDLDIETYINLLGDKLKEITLEKIKRYKVSVQWVGRGQFEDKWTLYNCIVWETKQNKRLFVLLEGKLFEIEEIFANNVRNFVRRFAVFNSELPPAKLKEKERNYNQRITKEVSGLICLDGITVKAEEARTAVEFCDLLSSRKKLIHIKRKTHSSTLSHLFAQGTVAARIFLSDENARKSIREQIKKITNNSDILATIPDENSRPNPNDYEIAYAIITKSVNNWPDSLPFFSCVNFMQNAKHLTELGFNVSLQKIDEI